MIIKAVRVRNFRCVRDARLDCDALTALVGANGAGKSTFLQALDLFYDLKPTLSDEDVCHHQLAPGGQVEIEVTYGDLSDAARAQFAKYVQADELTVVRVLRVENGRTLDAYHGSRLLRPELLPIRAAPATEAKKRYDALRDESTFQDLPPWRSKELAVAALDAWEELHPGDCTRARDDGQFFGFKGVGAGYLGRYTKFLLVPAVRDAARDGMDGRSSVFAELIDLVVRSALSDDDAIRALNADVARRYREIVEDAKGKDLDRIQAELTNALALYAPGTDVTLSWGAIGEIALPAPTAVAKVGEEGFHSSIERKGHGLQRAFVMTMLQYLESVRAARSARDGGDDPPRPDLVLGIEEPELYQHPDRQRHLAKVLLQLAMPGGPNRGPSTQVLYTTHSPHFVGLDRFDSIRVVRKEPAEPGAVPTTRVTAVTLEELARQLAVLCGRDPSAFSASTLRARLHALMTPWVNEGFFADVAVLVEGEQDRAAILGSAHAQRLDLDSIGVTVLPCNGKTNLDRPALIFRHLGIPTYLMWDGDEGEHEAKPELNRRLLRLLGEAETDYPAFVGAQGACLRRTIEDTLRGELGAGVFDDIVQELRSDLEMSRQDIVKNPTAMGKLFQRASERGARSATLEQIVHAALALRRRHVLPPAM